MKLIPIGDLERPICTHSFLNSIKDASCFNKGSVVWAWRHSVSQSVVVYIQIDQIYIKLYNIYGVKTLLDQLQPTEIGKANQVKYFTYFVYRSVVYQLCSYEMCLELERLTLHADKFMSLGSCFIAVGKQILYRM